MLIEKLDESEHWKGIVARTWSGSYLIKNSGRHYRKAMRVLGKALAKAASNWTGHNIWGSPVVALAPPFGLRKIRNDAVISVPIGARDAMISYREGGAGLWSRAN